MDIVMTVDKSFCTYLLHFTDQTHYVGMTGNLPRRMRQHHGSQGARYVKRKLTQGYDFVVAQTWDNMTRSEAMKLEYKLKKRGRWHYRYCPICIEETINE